jgi:hypothetical protein
MRATVALLQGDWQRALALHAFAPVLLAFTLTLAVSFLPESYRSRLIRRLEAIECRTGVSFLLLIGLLLYWGVSVIGFPDRLMMLVSGS